MADELAGGVPAHVLVGLNLYTGVSLLNEAVDPPGQNASGHPSAHGTEPQQRQRRLRLRRQRRGLLDVQRLGRLGARGWRTPGYYEAVPIGHDGAVWMGGAAPEVDTAGNIWVPRRGTGRRRRPTTSATRSSSCRRGWLARSTLRPTHGRPTTRTTRTSDRVRPRCSRTGPSCRWASRPPRTSERARSGRDLPPDATLNLRQRLRRRGRDLRDVVYVPCGDGVRAVQTSPALSVQWQASSGAHDPPITAGGLVWSIGGSTLFGLNPASGATVWSVSVGGQANHFPTPSVGDGLLRHRARTKSSLSRARRGFRARRRHHRRRRRTPRTGSSPPTAASSRSATPASTARPAACP